MLRIKGAADGSARKRVRFVLMPMMASVVGQNRSLSVAFFYLLYQIFWGSVKFQAVHLIVLRNFHLVGAYFSFLSIAWKLKEQLRSVFPPKFLTGWLILVLVNVCYLLQSWVNFPTISCCCFLFDTALLLFLWLACLPCHPRFYLCASCITSPDLHTFGSCGFCKYSQACEKNQKHFVL
jgi:hypothetical protein